MRNALLNCRKSYSLILVLVAISFSACEGETLETVAPHEAMTEQKLMDHIKARRPNAEFKKNANGEYLKPDPANAIHFKNLEELDAFFDEMEMHEQSSSNIISEEPVK